MPKTQDVIHARCGKAERADTPPAPNCVYDQLAEGAVWLGDGVSAQLDDELQQLARCGSTCVQEADAN